MRTTLKMLAALSASAVLAACTTVPAPPRALQAAWVVLGEHGQALARAVTTAGVCPDLLQDGIARPMHVRAPAATLAQRPTVSAPENSKASAFPVRVCEAPLDAAARSASVDGQALPLPQPLVRKIVVIGDTGCRVQSGANNYVQGCRDGAQWAFAEVARAAARFGPDLVLHVGDYHYRENACPDGNPLCAGSPWGYGWDTWQADFFDPAAPLLAAAPWVMVRGNHESCSRAGQGWWRLLDPRPLQAGRDCNEARNDMNGDYSDPYAVPLGGAAAQAAQLIVFDSAKVPNLALAPDSAAFATYRRQVQQAGALATPAGFNFFVEHHPVLGFATERKSSELKVYPGNAALQGVLEAEYGQRLFPDGVQATLAGHVHVFEALTFASGHAAQFVSGNGGSSLDMPLPQPLAAGATPYAAAVPDIYRDSNEPGFMTLERQDDGWLAQAWNRHGSLLTTCRITAVRTRCN